MSNEKKPLTTEDTFLDDYVTGKENTRKEKLTSVLGKIGSDGTEEDPASVPGDAADKALAADGKIHPTPSQKQADKLQIDTDRANDAKEQEEEARVAKLAEEEKARQATAF